MLLSRARFSRFTILDHLTCGRPQPVTVLHLVAFLRHQWLTQYHPSFSASSEQDFTLPYSCFVRGAPVHFHLDLQGGQ